MAEAGNQSGSRARPAKAAGAFRTISEVANELDVPPHVLRFWESRFSHIRPMKRAGGRRYYRPEDVDLLRRIRDLLYGQGYTIKGVQKILRESGAKSEAERAPPRARPTAATPRPVVEIRKELETLLAELRGLAEILKQPRR